MVSRIACQTAEDHLHSTDPSKLCQGLLMMPNGSELQTVLDSTEAGILIHDAESKSILWANPAARRLFGLSLEELQPSKTSDMSSPERRYRRSVGVAWLQEAVDSGNSRIQWKYRSKTGEEFLTDASATHITLDSGPAVMVEFRVITEQVDLEQQLRKTTTRLERVLNHTSASVILMDTDRYIVDFTPHTPSLFDIEGSRLLRSRLDELGTFNPSLDNPSVVSRLGVSGSPIPLSMKHIPANGIPQWLTGQLEAVDHDTVTSLAFVVRDKTEQVELQRQSAQQQANLNYLSRQNAMGDMAMMLAHELGQPLSASSNFLSGLEVRLRDGSPSAALEEGLAQVKHQIDRASSIVRAVKQYVSRFESSSTLQDLNDTIRESLYFVSLRAEESQIHLIEDLTEEQLPVRAENVLIGQVIINLCFNAIDEIIASNTDDRSITISSKRIDDSVHVDISDAGRGFPWTTLDSSFDTTFSRKDHGSGIGLTISKQIMDRHDGNLELLPRAAQGTTARITLPLTPL